MSENFELFVPRPREEVDSKAESLLTAADYWEAALMAAAAHIREAMQCGEVEVWGRQLYRTELALAGSQLLNFIASSPGQRESKVMRSILRMYTGCLVMVTDEDDMRIGVPWSAQEIIIVPRIDNCYETTTGTPISVTAMQLEENEYPEMLGIAIRAANQNATDEEYDLLYHMRERMLGTDAEIC